MTARNVKLGKQPCKLTHDLTLLQNEKSIVEASEGTLVLPITVNETVKGYFFAGKGHLTVDTIVETPQGAVGKPMSKDLNQQFLMFGKIDDVSGALSAVTNEDFSRLGYEDMADFLVKANVSFSQFFSCSSKGIDLGNFEKDSHLFGFSNTDGEWRDTLISKGDKIVYASAGRVYISRDLSEEVSARSEPVLFSVNGKNVVVGKNNILVDFMREEK